MMQLRVTKSSGIHVPGNQKSCLMPDIADLIFSLVSIHKMLQETVGIIAEVK